MAQKENEHAELSDHHQVPAAHFWGGKEGKKISLPLDPEARETP